MKLAMPRSQPSLNHSSPNFGGQSSSDALVASYATAGGRAAERRRGYRRRAAESTPHERVPLADGDADLRQAADVDVALPARAGACVRAHMGTRLQRSTRG